MEIYDGECMLIGLSIGVCLYALLAFLAWWWPRRRRNVSWFRWGSRSAAVACWLAVSVSAIPMLLGAWWAAAETQQTDEAACYRMDTYDYDWIEACVATARHPDTRWGAFIGALVSWHSPLGGKGWSE